MPASKSTTTTPAAAQRSLLVRMLEQ
jgi:hypothetical protein